MQIVFTPSLLQFLIRQNYRYCLSSTKQVKSRLADVLITLLPVQRPPLAASFPDGFEEYFMIREEPAVLAEGIEGVLTVACLDKTLLMAYITSLLDSMPLSRKDG